MSVESILLAMAQNAGRAKRDSGALWGGLVSDAANLPAHIIEDKRLQRTQALRESQLQQQIALETARAHREEAAATRQAGLDTRADADYQRKLKRQKDTEQVLASAIGDSGDPRKFDAQAAYAKSRELGDASLVRDAIAAHREITGKVTEFDPAKGSQDELGNVIRQPVNVPKPPTGPEMDYAAQQLYAKKKLGLKLTPQEEADIAGFEERKRVISDPASVAATDRQTAAIAAAAAAQQRAFEHSEAMANRKKDARPVTSGDAGRIAENLSSLDDVKRLQDALTAAGETGTLAKVGASMPNFVTDLTGIGTEAKKKQALIDRVKQVIGKALEGGVLRKEDELKYEKILPTIGDTTEVVKAKLSGLDSAIRQKNDRFLESLSDAGYDTDKFTAPKPTESTTGDGLGYADYLKAKKK